MRELYESTNGKQPGDPAKLAQALLTITGEARPPFRFIAGADALAQAEEKLRNVASRSTPTATSPRRWPSTTPHEHRSHHRRPEPGRSRHQQSRHPDSNRGPLHYE